MRLKLLFFEAAAAETVFQLSGQDRERLEDQARLARILILGFAMFVQPWEIM